ncbi:MAG: nitroreductase family deazaflavin-dependent oxidoreductase [Acidimicrobiia bacterium]|nr:nitroreductase family deazaflavin-dependent oxidoreductase [Acidimicrobiia bacterium]
MSARDSFSFRQKPSGLFKWILKVPGWMFRIKLGFLFGDRFILITHSGRKSGATYHTPLEVVVHDEATGEYIVCSGTGPNADWYRNISATPAAFVQVRNRAWTPEQRMLTDEEAATRFAEYERAHAKTAERLLTSMGRSYDGTDTDRVRMMAHIPMVSFTDPVHS